MSLLPAMVLKSSGPVQTSEFMAGTNPASQPATTRDRDTNAITAGPFI